MSAAHAETTPEDAAKELSRYHIVDVREASEFEGPLGHLAGAQFIALGELEARAGEIPADTPLLMVCRSGNRSGKACDTLAHLGRSGAVNLAGGMIAWHGAGLPVVRSRFKNARAIRDAFAAWLSQVKRMPIEEATARVRSADEAEKDEQAAPSSVVAHTITRLEGELRAEPHAPADLGLVCAALRADAKALDKRADESSGGSADASSDASSDASPNRSADSSPNKQGPS